MKIKLMKRIGLLALTTFLLTNVSALFALDVQGDSFDAEFKITSWSATNTDSTITSEGIVGEGFGKVYLTHTLDLDLVITLREILMVKLDPLIMMESWSQLPSKEYGREKVRL